MIRTALSPAALAPALVREVHALDRESGAVGGDHDARADRSHDVVAARWRSAILAVSAALAALLAASASTA